MVTRVQTVAFQGIQALPVDVQVQVANGMPAFNIVGLPDKAVGESKERVRSALTSSGLSLPPKRITINLAPADLPKEGSHFDLPIALALLVGDFTALTYCRISRANQRTHTKLLANFNRSLYIVEALLSNMRLFMCEIAVSAKGTRYVKAHIRIAYG